jgi:AraC-like DNA-binding protein
LSVSTRDRLERLTKPFQPDASSRRLLAAAEAAAPFAETVIAEVCEASPGDRMHKLILVETGQLDVEGTSGGWLIVPGHLIFVPADRAFRIRSAPGTTLRVAHLDPADATWIHHGCWTAAATPLAREMLLQGTSWSPADVAGGGTARLFFRTLSGLCGQWFTNPRMLWLPAVRSEPLRRAVLHLRDHLDDAPLDDVAAAAGLSGRTLQRHCQAELGLLWRDLVREARMMRALELLVARRAPVGDVARQVGFATGAAFTTAFAKRFGLTPTDYVARRCAASWFSSRERSQGQAEDSDETILPS